MYKSAGNSLIPFFFLVTILLLLPAPEVIAQPNAMQNFTIGLISSKPKKRITQTTPLANYLATQLPAYEQGKVVVNESLHSMAAMLKAGTVKMVATTGYAGLLIEQISGAPIVALRWKQGVESYHSVIFSRKDTQLNNLQDLKGRTLVFERDSSTSAFFIPSIYLLNQGFMLQRVSSLDEKPDVDKVGYLFLSDLMRKANEINMSIGVYKGRFDAATFSNLDWADTDTTPAKAKDELQILAKTPAFPRAVVLLSPTLDETQQRQIIQALIDAEKSEQGVVVMKRFKKTTRFSEISLAIAEQLQLAKKQMAAHPELYR